MKVIDLLNKIANGEEVPEKIVFDDIVYKVKHNYDVDKDYYLDDEGNLLLNQINDVYKLNKEVEVIEEDKKIEKLREPLLQEETLNYVKLLKSKINEIIDKINKGE